MRAICSMFGAISSVISLTWKRLRLENFSRMNVTVFISAPFIMAIILRVRPLFSLFIAPHVQDILHLFLHKLRCFSQTGAIPPHVRADSLSNIRSDDCGTASQEVHRQYRTGFPKAYS